MISLKSLEEKCTIVETCSCIIVGKDKSERLCGRPVKENGVCGLHKKKCVREGEEEPSPKPREPSPKQREPSPKRREPSPKRREPSPKPREPSPKRREPSKKVIDKPPKGKKCICIIRSKKKGEPDKVCGRPIKENGRCGIHQKTCNTIAVPSTCPCIVIKTNKVCGRKVKANGKCHFHQKTCKIPEEKKVALVETKEEKELDELADALEDVFEDEPIPEVKEIEEPIQEREYIRQAENVLDLKEVYNYLVTVPDKEEVDAADVTEYINKLTFYLTQ